MYNIEDEEILRKNVAYIYDANGNELTNKAEYVHPHDITMKQSTSALASGQSVAGEISELIDREEKNEIRYAGEYFDESIGLYYLRARYYNPYTGRFVSEDSYWGEDVNPASLNLYVYCYNDPIKFVDPSGHWGGEAGERDDSSLSVKQQKAIIIATENWYASEGDEEEQDKWHNVADDISSGKIDPEDIIGNDERTDEETLEIATYLNVAALDDNVVSKEEYNKIKYDKKNKINKKKVKKATIQLYEKEGYEIKTEDDQIVIDINKEKTWYCVGMDVSDSSSTMTQSMSGARSANDVNEISKMQESKSISNAYKNRGLDLNEKDLAYLFYIDIHGVRDYLTTLPGYDSKKRENKSRLREKTFQKLFKRSPQNYKKELLGDWYKVEDKELNWYERLWAKTQSEADVLFSRKTCPQDAIDIIEPALLATMAVQAAIYTSEKIAMLDEGVDKFGKTNAFTMYTHGVLEENLTQFNEILAQGTGSINVRVLDEVADLELINRVKELRGSLTSRLKKSGNFAIGNVEIDGVNRNEFFAHSGVDELTDTLVERAPNISLQPQNPAFKAIEAANKNGEIYLRDSCTEYKILNDLADRLIVNKNANGKIKLFTELKPCDSCKNIIDNFSNTFKNIEINVIHNNDVRLTK